MVKKFIIAFILIFITGLAGLFTPSGSKPILGKPRCRKSSGGYLRFIEGWNTAQIASYLNYDGNRPQLAHIVNSVDF